MHHVLFVYLLKLELVFKLLDIANSSHVNVSYISCDLSETNQFFFLGSEKNGY
jgi:hypothetical protein